MHLRVEALLANFIALTSSLPSARLKAKAPCQTSPGDVWHGAFALSLAESNDEVNAIKFANSAATLKCKFFGGRDGFPNRQQVDQFLMEYK